MFFFHVLLLQHGCSENTPYDFFKRKLSLVGGDNRGHLHENIAPGAGTFTYFLQPISPSPRLCPGWGDRGFTLTGALNQVVAFVAFYSQVKKNNLGLCCCEVSQNPFKT